MINLFNVSISPKTQQLVKQVLKSGHLSEGEIVKQFERKLKKFGLSNPVAVNSGTSALHLALIESWIREGDEVILPAQTFIATGMAVLMCKAKPVFADIDLKTGNILPQSIKEKITDRTKAIIPVDWAGYPCDLEEIGKIANDYNLKIIEDAAQALGAVYRNRKIGSISDFTTFSFQATKHLTTGDGGAVCVSDEDDMAYMHYCEIRELRWFRFLRHKKPNILGERIDDIYQIGYKYHMNDYSAALGLGEIDRLPEKLKKRRHYASIYNKELINVPGIELLEYKEDRQSAYWIYPILVENRLNFVKKLRAKGIEALSINQNIARFAVFQYKIDDLLNQEYFDKHQVSLPVHDGLTEKDVRYIVKIIKEGW